MGVLVYLAPTFEIQGVQPQAGADAKNVSNDANFSAYKLSGDPLSITGTSITIFGISIAIGLVVSWAIKSPVPIGAALFTGIVAALYVQSNTIIKGVIPSNIYWIITGIIDIVFICIGIIVMFTVIEIFSGQMGVDQ